MALLFVFFAVAQSWGLTGLFSYVDGEVALIRGGSEQEAEIGMAVQQGDVITTGPDSLAIIAIQDQADLKLRSETRLAMETLDQTVSARLETGGVFSRVAKSLRRKYFIRTDAAVAGVRGTEFFVAYGRTIDDLPDVWLCVNEGSVRVNVEETGDQTTVRAGLGINIVGGRKLTKARRYPWTRRLNWNVDPSKGEVEDNTDLDQAYSDLLDQDYD
jgi:hypothetical protein